MPKGDWSWHDEDGKESTVVPSVQAIAVYTNPSGEIVVRQQNEMGEDDNVVIIPRTMAKVIAKAITEEAKKDFTPNPG